MQKADHLPGPSLTQNSGQEDPRVATLIARLEAVFRTVRLYKQLLEFRDSDAQKLLNVFQSLLDIPGLDAAFRRSLIVATQRLSAKSGLYPVCYELKNVVQDGEHPITAGGFADIYKADFQGQKVCLKALRIYRDTAVDDFLKQFSKEAILWGQLSHPNVLPIYGLYRFQKRICLVSPWMDAGDITFYLKHRPEAPRLQLAVDVAQGLAYLHENKIIHGDLKGPNILIDDTGRACLADFGISSVSDSQIPAWTSYSSVASKGGSIRWQAPELFDLENDEAVRNSVHSDMYALACVCYEIFTGDVPFAKVQRDTAIMLQVKSGARPTRPPSSSLSWSDWGLTENIWSLMEDCWAEDPASRSTIDQVIERLKLGLAQDGRSSASGSILSPSRFRERMREPLDLLNLPVFEGLLRPGGYSESPMSHGAILDPDSTVDSISSGPLSEPHQFIPTTQRLSSEPYPPALTTSSEPSNALQSSANHFGAALDSTMTTVSESPPQILPQAFQITLQEFTLQSSFGAKDEPSRTSSPEIEDLTNPLELTPQALTRFGQADSTGRANNSPDPYLQDENGDGNPLPPPFRLGPYPAKFHAFPLLPDDLPFTTITVSHSFVRVNDRGKLKRVLSFVVFVDPGNGKDAWKVEKTYSDILGLDQRMRKAVGKRVGEKIYSLPEEKLWKDLAPAMLDRGKAALKEYLQMLINLPVKNNEEVIAFFTSDIIRETHWPVMKNGYKEGYLTKRGKNFGGWKVRYFVLQGPILVYYEDRDGAHLGSIQLAGAQIGRQRREPTANTNENKEYRHALLIVETAKGVGGDPIRHVLCAESDEERDAWVNILVRYFYGTYSDEPLVSAPA